MPKYKLENIIKEKDKEIKELQEEKNTALEDLKETEDEYLTLLKQISTTKTGNTINNTTNNTEDVLIMLDTFLRNEGQWWDGFYTDREKEIPFFVELPKDPNYESCTKLP